MYFRENGCFVEGMLGLLKECMVVFFVEYLDKDFWK